MAKIRYVGSKPSKMDNIAGTGVVWNGNGDVKNIPDRVVPLLLAHPDVWALDDGETVNQAVDIDPAKMETQHEQDPLSETDSKAPMVNLETMDKDGLREYAQRYFGHTFHHNTGEGRMRDEIIGLMNRG